jgi:hypothetical protein
MTDDAWRWGHQLKVDAPPLQALAPLTDLVQQRIKRTIASESEPSIDRLYAEGPLTRELG